MRYFWPIVAIAAVAYLLYQRAVQQRNLQELGKNLGDLAAKNNGKLPDLSGYMKG